jgi:hypothetical protein
MPKTVVKAKPAAKAAAKPVAKPARRAQTKAVAPAPNLTNPNGYDPTVWGPHMWFVFHLAAATYPDPPSAADKANYQAFYGSLQNVLPCPGCREGYKVIISSEPTKLGSRVFASRASLFKWTVDVHNRVNAKLGKPMYDDWQAWYREYDKLR